ncbi:MAG TPA: hypothetical protein VKX41_15365 [Alloacidobacterium sp.]|nr:hypothetical protein [Alloacidobacterium sp.]
MSRLVQILSVFLGILMFMFGFLKFFAPINGWFEVQIQQSHLPHATVLVGKLAEMATGALFLLSRFSSSKQQREYQILFVACSSLVFEMLVALYVHVQPRVPPGVLPLGIKAPVLPLFVLVLGVVTALVARKQKQSSNRDLRSSE